MARSLFQWLISSPSKVYLFLVFVWATFIFGSIAITQEGFGKGLLSVPMIGIGAALYMGVLNLNPVQSADDRWRDAISKGTLPSWIGYMRLLVVVLPFYVYGWVPQKLCEFSFSRFQATDKDNDDTSSLRSLVSSDEGDVVISIINQNPSDAVELVKLLADQDSEVRENAAGIIGSIGRNDHHAPEAVRLMLPEISNILKWPNSEARVAATSALVGIAWHWLDWEDFEEIILPMLPVLVELRNDSNLAVGKNVLECLKVVAEWMENTKQSFDRIKMVVPWLEVCLNDRDRCDDAVWMLRAVAGTQPDLVRPMISEIAKLLRGGHDEHVRLGSSATLKHIVQAYPGAGRLIIVDLVVAIDDSFELVRQNAALTVGFSAEEQSDGALVSKAIPIIMELLNDRRPVFRVEAVNSLVGITNARRELTEGVVSELRALLEDAEESVRNSAAAALRILELRT